ncbi:MAG TPA: N-acetyltransferase [Chloroflexi bacterium]|nr:N-acetyltransferase [Chloroflexota bacterium]
MPDMLVKLYELQDDWSFLQTQAAKGIAIRKPIGPEKHLIEAWVEEHFSDAWSSEVDMALANRPLTCFIALKGNELIGFACYDATALGFFGPTGVAEEHRGQGTGKALLQACLLDMKLKGYGYAVIGAVGPAAFYANAVGAVEIPDSTPSIWKNWLHTPEEHL